MAYGNELPVSKTSQTDAHWYLLSTLANTSPVSQSVNRSVSHSERQARYAAHAALIFASLTPRKPRSSLLPVVAKRPLVAKQNGRMTIRDGSSS